VEKKTLGFRSAWHWTSIGVLLAWGLVANCWGQQVDWESCIRQDLPATRELISHEILKSIPCPAGVGGECFGEGARWNLFTQYNSGPCSHLQYPAGSCRGWQGESKVCIVAGDWNGPPRFPFRFIHSSNPPVISYVKRRSGLSFTGGLNQTKIENIVQRTRSYNSDVFIQGTTVTLKLEPNPDGKGGKAVISKDATHYWEFTGRQRPMKTYIEFIIRLQDGTYNGNLAWGDCSFIKKHKEVNVNGIATESQSTGVDRWKAAYDPSKKEWVLTLPGQEANEWILR
jgi:hypothetical protein